MDNIDRLGKIEAIALLITVIGNNIILNLPTAVLNYTGSGSWLHIIYLSILTFTFVLLICKLFKPFVQADILDVSEYLGGKVLKLIIGLLYIFLFISFSAACLKYFANSLQTIYFNDTPLLFLIILLLLPVVICCKYGLKAISGTNLIFIPLTMISIIILLFAASKDFVWQRLFPVFGYGIKNTFVTQLGSISIFNVVGYLYFIKPYLKKENNFKIVSIICMIVCILYFFISIVSLLMTFPFITQTDETLSLYLLTRLVSFGKFFQRVDAIFIFFWILTIISFISINVYIITIIVKKLINLQFSSELSYSVTAILLGISLAFSNTATLKSYNRSIYKTSNAIVVFIISFIVLLLAYLKYKKKEHKHENK